MNNKKSIIASVALAASLLATSMPAFAYSDVGDDHWAKSYVDSLSGENYISGYEDGTYRPNEYITRAEFVKILTNIFKPMDKSGVVLPDVNDSAWYADTMKLGVKAGYLNGYADGTVHPEDNISREQAAVMTYRAWQLTPEGKLGFSDSAEVSEWAKNEVATLASKNVINGYEDGTYRPAAPITRAEVAKIIAKAITLGTDTAGTTTGVSGTTSGVVHVGSSSSNGTVTRSSSGGSSGGGSSSSSGLKKDAVKPVDPETPEEGVDQVVVVAVDADDVIDAVGGKLADEATAVVSLDITGKGKDDVTINYLKPVAKGDGTYDLVPVTGATVDEFNKDMEEGNYTKEQVKDILDNIELVVPSDVDANNLSVNIGVKDDKDQVVAEEKTDVYVNYVIESLKDFQNGEGDNNDLVVVVKSYIKGYSANETAAKKWLNTNARSIKAYMDVAKEVSKVFKDVEITEDNYKTYVKYFNAMIDVVDNAVSFVANKGGNLTKAQAIDYATNDVQKSIRAAIDEEHADEVCAVAKAFGVKFASLLDTMNEAVKAVSTSDRKAIVLDVYNGDYSSK